MKPQGASAKPLKKTKIKRRNLVNTDAPVVVIGTVAIDSVETPFGSRERVFGGSASYFSYASSFFAPVALVANIGRDFPSEYRAILGERKIDLSHLEVSDGKTFYWRGRYGLDLNCAETLETQLNVLQIFRPQVHFKKNPPFLFLANIDPELQINVLDQMSKPRPQFVACDTMNFWIRNKKKSLTQVLARVDCAVLNDGEAREFTGESNLIRAGQKIKGLGPAHVVIKKGEHGVLLFTEHHFFALPSYPLETVFDPTGAGDTFAGGMMGYLASRKSTEFEDLKRAIAYGSVMASFTVEDFGLESLRRIKRKDIDERLELFRKISSF